MKKFFPDRKHISILTHLFITIFFFLTLYFSSTNKILAASCCQNGYSPVNNNLCCPADTTLNTNTNVCSSRLNPAGSSPLAQSCDFSAERCQNNVCIPTSLPTSIDCSIPGNGGRCFAPNEYKCETNINRAGLMCCANATACLDLNRTATQIYDYQKVTVCTYAGDKEGECNSCLTSKGIWTALGCIPFNQDEFVVSVVKIIINVAGLITLVMMLIATVMLMTGGGNSEQMKRGKEIFTGAVVGLLFLIFSVVILQIITKDIIKIDITEPDAPGSQQLPPVQPI